VRPVSPYRQALKVAHVDERAAQRWQAVAALTDAVFVRMYERDPGDRPPLPPSLLGLHRTLDNVLTLAALSRPRPWCKTTGQRVR